MRKNIAIIGLNGNLVEIYSINLDLLGKNLEDQDFFDEAWKCAIEKNTLSKL